MDYSEASEHWKYNILIIRESPLDLLSRYKTSGSAELSLMIENLIAYLTLIEKRREDFRYKRVETIITIRVFSA